MTTKTDVLVARGFVKFIPDCFFIIIVTNITDWSTLVYVDMELAELTKLLTSM